MLCVRTTLILPLPYYTKPNPDGSSLGLLCWSGTSSLQGGLLAGRRADVAKVTRGLSGGCVCVYVCLGQNWAWLATDGVVMAWSITTLCCSIISLFPNRVVITTPLLLRWALAALCFLHCFYFLVHACYLLYRYILCTLCFIKWWYTAWSRAKL